MYKYAATGECALLLRYLLCPSPCHIHRVATPSSPPTYPDILLSCRLEMLDWTREMSEKIFFLDFLNCPTSLRPGGWLQVWENWLLMKFDARRSFRQLFIGCFPSIIHPVGLNTTCGCNWRNILNQVQGTKCKCESVLSSWISINHNHALNIIIEKTVNSCVGVWNAEFSITHLYKFPDD